MIPPLLGIAPGMALATARGGDEEDLPDALLDGPDTLWSDTRVAGVCAACCATPSVGARPTVPDAECVLPSFALRVVCASLTMAGDERRKRGAAAQPVAEQQPHFSGSAQTWLGAGAMANAAATAGGVGGGVGTAAARVCLGAFAAFLHAPAPAPAPTPRAPCALSAITTLELFARRRVDAGTLGALLDGAPQLVELSVGLDPITVGLPTCVSNGAPDLGGRGDGGACGTDSSDDDGGDDDGGEDAPALPAAHRRRRNAIWHLHSSVVKIASLPRRRLRVCQFEPLPHDARWRHEALCVLALCRAELTAELARSLGACIALRSLALRACVGLTLSLIHI